MGYPPASIVAVAIILPFLALIAVILRFWVRLRVAPSYLGADDWLIAAAVFLCLADGANLAVAAILGMQGRSYPGEVPYYRAKVEEYCDYAMVLIEKPLYGMMKLSVLFFYRRIFLVKKGFRRFNNATIVLITIWAVAFLIGEFAVCGGHREAMWIGGKHGACLDRNYLHLSFGITDVIGDILVVAMPFPYVSSLQRISQREKVAVAGIFALGALSTTAAIVRLGFIGKAVAEGGKGDGAKHASGTPPAFWSTVEAAVGVLAANLPPLGPLIRKAPSARNLWPSALIRSRRTTNKDSNHGDAEQLVLSEGASPPSKADKNFVLPTLNMSHMDRQSSAGWKGGAWTNRF